MGNELSNCTTSDEEPIPLIKQVIEYTDSRPALFNTTIPDADLGSARP
jgi:hypothetical protein